MNIAGLQKMTLLDFPGKVACTVFLQGCNFRCPFCHNSDLLGGSGPEGMTGEAFLAFLEKRRGILDGVCITGGEPTLQPELEQLLRDIKALGYPVKLDTNGSRPEVLKHLVAEGLVDYVAMDIKNCPARYAETAGMNPALFAPLEESVRYLLSGAVDYEFRTTVAAQLHDADDFTAIGQWLTALDPQNQAKRFFLQCYMDRDTVLTTGLSAPSREDMELFAHNLRPYVRQVEIRGMD